MHNKLFFKIADCEDEHEQIHQLNYETFVEEIPQHNGNSERKLIDRFHDKNIYCIAKSENQVIGMISACDKRPFSLEKKLDNFSDYFPPNKKMLELRLLSIKKEYRKTSLFKALINALYEFVIKGRYEFIIISGALREVKLYRHIGFIPFGPIVGSAAAPYQPMYIEGQRIKDFTGKFFNESA